MHSSTRAAISSTPPTATPTARAKKWSANLSAASAKQFVIATKYTFNSGLAIRTRAAIIAST
jgi:hypothetical protein